MVKPAKAGHAAYTKPLKTMKTKNLTTLLFILAIFQATPLNTQQIQTDLADILTFIVCWCI